jgi:integrase
MTKILTAVSLKNLRPKAKVYEVSDKGCRGLRVTVQTSGHLSWAVRYRFRGMPRKIVLGSVLIEDRAQEVHPDSGTVPMLDTPLSLTDARWLAAQALRQVKSGVDPAAAKQAALRNESPADTVRTVSEKYIERKAHLRSRAQRQYDLTLINAVLGSHLITAVKRSDVVRLLDKIERDNGPAAADRVKSTWQILARWHAGRSDDFRPPILLKDDKRNMAKARARVLSDDELRQVWRAADNMAGPFGRYVQFLLTTSVRRNEASGLRRSELTNGGTTWIIPAARYKTGHDLLVPLSGAAQQILESIPIICNGDVVFTTDGKRPIGGFSRFKRLLDQVAGISDRWTLHDLRRTARTLMSRAGVDADIAEKCLGHAVGTIRATYDRHEYENEKRDAFELLAGQIARIVNPESKVVEMPKRRRR